eukprot:15262668-Alexandrium_andersonii.AAC.1
MVELAYHLEEMYHYVKQGAVLLDMLQDGDYPPVFVSRYVAGYEASKHGYQEAVRAVHRLEAARGVDPEFSYGERKNGIDRPRRINIS